MAPSSAAIVRDEHGKWLRGFGRNIGRCKIERAEFWAIYDGLQYAWSIKWKEVTVEIDCDTTIKVIIDDLKRHTNRDLASRIQELCNRD